MKIVIHWDILLILIQINATVSTHFSEMSALSLLSGSGILPPPSKKNIVPNHSPRTHQMTEFMIYREEILFRQKLLEVKTNNIPVSANVT